MLICPRESKVKTKKYDAYKEHCLTDILELELWTYILMASSEAECFTDSKDSQQNISIIKWIVRPI